MKKLTLAIAAVVMGFVMAACNTTSPKETIMKATDAFFTQAEEEVQAIDKGEDFMAHFAQFEKDKAEFLQMTLADYTDEEGNIKGFTEDEWNELQSYMYDRATAYNKVEGAKAAEFMEPIIANYENAINALCDAAGNVDEEAFGKLVDNFQDAEEGLGLFADYDNVPVELQQRAQAAEAKLQDLLNAMNPVGQ